MSKRNDTGRLQRYWNMNQNNGTNFKITFSALVAIKLYWFVVEGFSDRTMQICAEIQAITMFMNVNAHEFFQIKSKTPLHL